MAKQDFQLIGKNIRRERERLDKKVYEVAQKAGISPEYLTQIEKGSRTPKNDGVILDILIKGLDFRYSEAQKMLGKWRIEENAEKYNIKNLIINDGEIHIRDININ